MCPFLLEIREGFEAASSEYLEREGAAGEGQDSVGCDEPGEGACGDDEDVAGVGGCGVQDGDEAGGGACGVGFADSESPFQDWLSTSGYQKQGRLGILPAIRP